VQTPLPGAQFRLAAGSESLTITRPLVYRYVDDVLGDRTAPFAVTPPVSVSFAGSAVLFRDASAREVPVRVQSFAGAAAVEGKVALELPAGWSAQPSEQAFKIDKDGNALTLRFNVTPPSASAAPTVRAVATVNGVRYDSSVIVIRYPHIPTQTILQPAATRFTRADVRVLAKTVGYIEGAGDDVPCRPSPDGMRGSNRDAPKNWRPGRSIITTLSSPACEHSTSGKTSAPTSPA
jgi:hypothetical protein